MALVTRKRRERRLRTAAWEDGERREGSSGSGLGGVVPRLLDVLLARWRSIAGMCLFLVALLWFAPLIVAKTSLLSWVLSSAASDLNGSVTFQSASLGWFSPVELRGVAIRDNREVPVVSAERIKGRKSLLSLLWDTARPGHFLIEKPKITLEIRRDGSNLEDLIAEYLKPSEKETEAVECSIQIVGGTVEVHDKTADRKWAIEELEAAMTFSPDPAEPFLAKASGQIANAKQPGRFDLEYRTGPDPEDPQAPGGVVRLNTKDVPLVLSDVVLQRISPETRLAGRLNSSLSASWDPNDAVGSIRVDGHITASEVLFTTPSLRGDTVRLDKLSTECRLTTQNRTVTIEKSAVTTDVGNFSLAGTLHHVDPEKATLGSFLRQSFAIEGRVDLEKLAAMLPNTLRIQEETKVTSGDVTLSFTSKREKEGMVWTGTLETSDLQATRQGRTLTWREPISVKLAAKDTAKGSLLEHLKCRSDFLTVDMAGSAEDFGVAASFDLDKLAAQLDPFIDLTDVEMTGKGWLNGRWRQGEAEKFETDFDLQLRDFIVASGGEILAQEQNLVAFLNAKGATDFGDRTNLDSAEFELTSGEERLSAKLTAPVAAVSLAEKWPVALTARGELPHWVQRLRPWLDMGEMNIEGGYRIDAEATASSGGVTVAKCDIQVDEFFLQTPDLYISEPKMTFNLKGEWDAAARRVFVKSLRSECSTVALTATDTVVGLPKEGEVEILGDVTYRADLTRLQQWFADATKPMNWRVEGDLAGSATLKHQNGRVVGHWDTTIRDFVTQAVSGRQYHDPNIRLVADAVYDKKTATVIIEKGTLESRVCSAEASARLDDLAKNPNVKVDGWINYDLDRLSVLLQPYWDNNVRIIGRGKAPVSLSGPLALDKLESRAKIEWVGANVAEFQVGPGMLDATLKEGLVQAAPLRVAVSEGTLSLSPKVRVAPGPITLELPSGPLVEQVRINPRMCAYGLKFIAPILSETTAADGTFSIHLERCRVPITDPKMADLQGRFVVHSIQVGPGPLLRDLVALFGVPSSVKLVDNSAVDFRMAEGRIYHENLEFLVPHSKVKMRGWVGLDHRISLLAEVPIAAPWLDGLDSRVKSQLQGRVVSIPITGTLENPQIDSRSLAQLQLRAVGDQVRGRLEEEAGRAINTQLDKVNEELNRQLDKLLPPFNRGRY